MLSRSQWRKTPYSGTTAKNTHDNITRLLTKYGCKNQMYGRGTGNHRREAVSLRFQLKDKSYRIVIETLDADAKAIDLYRQAERCIFHLLKSQLELSEIFMSVEKALFQFMELGDGHGTLFEMGEKEINKIAANPGGYMLALSSGRTDAEAEIIEGDIL